MRKAIVTLFVLGLAMSGVSGAHAADPIPPHPAQLAFPPLDYKVPPAAQFREVFSNGLVVYIAEDRMLPTFDLRVTIRTGAAFDPPGKAGLAGLVGEQLRDGGTESLSPEELDERVEFLAASLFSGVGDTAGSAGLGVLAKDIDAGLGLLVEMLRHPRFDEDRLRLAKERMLQNVKRRNDSTDSIIGIEWGFLMNGDGHYSNRYPSSDSIGAITREDLIAFHRRYYHPGNMIIAVAGDFNRADMLAKLGEAFGAWPAGEKAPVSFPAPDHTPTPGVYVVQKDDVNQGRVVVGHKSILRGSPDEFALKVMDSILGGGGFRSRLVKKVRSDEGLAYDVGSQFSQGTYYPGEFQCWFQSKSDSCAFAARLVIDEIRLIQHEKVSQLDVDDTVTQIVDGFPRRFQSKMAILRTYARDEYTGRDTAYWQTYVENLRRVTVDDVWRVAQKYLHPDELIILAVGDVEAILGGGHSKVPNLRFDAFGTPTRLPLRDPDTLKR